MPTILDEIAAHTRIRVAKAKEERPAEALMEEVLALPRGSFVFEEALKKPGLSFICECKKASPSKGVIAEDFPYLDIARDYAAAGADAISVLTEPEWFLGRNAYAEEIAKAVPVPVLRKDFTVDPYMICEAKLLGASAVLLIVAILSAEELREDLNLCGRLGLSALVECHDEREIDEALNAGARIVGVNNRNLRDFSVDTSLSDRLGALIPDGIVLVSESGVKGAEDIARLKNTRADAVLVGEALMRATDRQKTLRAWKALS
ncbi:MAG: indole-3-glycerol phosphate synthase TrpC [Lachnospiraceae bacterium]|nr:indole-3-glycerol phosphate synthase TrpC [Lachnospiraceae bacterium]